MEVLNIFAITVFFDLSILDSAIETGNVGKYKENTLLPADNIFLGCEGNPGVGRNPFARNGVGTEFS